MLIRLENDHFHTVDDRFTAVGDDEALPDSDAVILSLARFEAEGAALLAAGRDVGVRVGPADRVEALAAVAAQARPVTGADYLAQEKGTSTKITDPEAELALFISIARDPGSATWMAGSEPLHHRYDAWRAGPDAEAQINPPPKQRRKGAEASAEAASAEAT